jgi:signal peptidase II
VNTLSPVGVAASRFGKLHWLWLSVLVIAADQASKAVIVATLQLFERREWLPVLEITRLHNRGAAFSFLNDAAGWQHYLFLGLALVVTTGITVWLARLKGAVSVLLPAGLSLIAGGALGNAIDRVARGYVVDFIHVHWWQAWYFPAFNVADSAITIGAALLVLDSVLESGRTSQQG